MSKALLIKSQIDKNGGTVGQWNNFDNAPSYIQGIHTGDVLNDMSAEKLASLISGIPTPWARAKLFKFAFDNIATPDPNIEAGGLSVIYDMLHAEWKGLMAIIALYPDRVKFSDPVIMDTNGSNYNIAAAFGRMLLNDKDIWCNQDDLSKNPDSQPYIQLIYYRGHLVGGTSPFTGCFTGVDYSALGIDASDINWYRQGKFEDPINSLTPEEIQKVYIFVNNMLQNQIAFESKINLKRTADNRIDLNGFKTISRNWASELMTRGNNKLRSVGPLAQYGNLAIPFSILYKSDVPVYMKPDFTFTYTNDGNYTPIGDIQGLLSKDKFVIGWSEDKDELNKLSAGSVYYLNVKDISDGSTSYFTLPFSEQGIGIFKNSLSSILGYRDAQENNTKLSAQINDANQLAVSLVVEIDGEPVTLNKREYEISWMTQNNRVILWPNFVSENWNKYYVYSEFTSDSNKYFIPFFKSQGELVTNIHGDLLTADYTPTSEELEEVDKRLAEGKKDQNAKKLVLRNVNVKKLVEYPHGIGADDLLKYDIIDVDCPVAGVVATIKEAGKQCNAGFLMFKQDVVKDITSIAPNNNAVVGIDFGSNNTCVYYNAGSTGAQPIEFKNYRTMVVGKENTDKRSIAENNELLFFSNYESSNGQLKSWLHEHDSRYNTHNEAAEIAGGVPVNRPNVLVNDMNEYVIKTQAGNLHYNMKWLNDEAGLKKKRAFIKSIWLEACAFLYQKRIMPTQINWSFPGSMMDSDVNDLEVIFQDICRTTPIKGRRPTLNPTPITEAEAVCSFALSNDDIGLASNNMFLGIDVGGSTSDILLIARDTNNANRPSLFRESSVRLAAGVFFNTVIKSEAFRRALLDFHESKVTKVYVANIQEIITEEQKAPYYLNSIFDQLRTEDDYDKFYDSIAGNAKIVFTLPAYVTGLLLYYSGMLIGKTIKDHDLNNIDKIDVLSFGKGGRLFHWLRNAVGGNTTISYYRRCLNAGVKRLINKELQVIYRNEIEVDNKAEVAKGLCDMQNLNKISLETLSDICGEVGVRFTDTNGASRELTPDDELTSEYFENDMSCFNFENMECFNEFFNIFINFVGEKTRLCSADDDLRTELIDLRNKVSTFICQDSEYKSAKRKANFAYHQPLIIAEGACFLEKSLIKKVF